MKNREPVAAALLAVLILGGDAPAPDELALLDEADLVVASDNGAACLFAADRAPDLIVGDFDSLPPDLQKVAADMGVKIQRHPIGKDETDGELALREILKEEPDALLVLGGHGGRSGMFLHHIGLLAVAHDAGVDAEMRGHGEAIRVMEEGDELVLEESGGLPVDVLALEGPAVVDLDGFRFGGKGVELTPGSGRGLSNEVVKEPATLAVARGRVVVVLRPGTE